MVSLPWWGYVLITAVLIAITNITKKHILNHEHALEQMAAEGPFRLVAILFMVPFIGVPNMREFGFIFLAAFLLFFTILYRNKSYRHLPISTVAPLMNLSPIFLIFIAALILGERITIIQLFGILMVMSGGYLLDLKNKNPLGPLLHAAKSPYTATVIVTLILLSFMGTMDKYILGTEGIPALTYLFWLYLIYTTIALVAHISQYGAQQIHTDIKKAKWWLALTGVLAVAEISLLYYVLSIPGVLISLVVPLRRTATLLETAIGGSIFGEKHLLQKVAASVVMVIGVVLIV